MKPFRRGSKEPLCSDPEFAEALEDLDGGRASARRQFERKARQFCRQVQRALNVALPELRLGAGLDGVFVEGVDPAPDCGHLLVSVVLPERCDGRATMAALRAAAPGLRAEVAAAIARKRAPELQFVAVSGEAGDE